MSLSKKELGVTRAVRDTLRLGVVSWLRENSLTISRTLSSVPQIGPAVHQCPQAAEPEIAVMEDRHSSSIHTWMLFPQAL